MNGSNDDEPVIWLVLGFLALGGTSAAAFWSQITQWLIDHHILVDGSTHPAVMLPGTSAGLDLPRIAIAIAVVVALVAFGVFGMNRDESVRR